MPKKNTDKVGRIQEILDRGDRTETRAKKKLKLAEETAQESLEKVQKKKQAYIAKVSDGILRLLEIAFPGKGMGNKEWKLNGSNFEIHYSGYADHVFTYPFEKAGLKINAHETGYNHDDMLYGAIRAITGLQVSVDPSQKDFVTNLLDAASIKTFMNRHIDPKKEWPENTNGTPPNPKSKKDQEELKKIRKEMEAILEGENKGKGTRDH